MCDKRINDSPFRLQLREVYAESELFIRDLDVISIVNVFKMSDKFTT